MARRPSFQFYPADWRNNANLRRCSEAARGAWMDILCILHDSDEYGIARYPLVELARAAGVTLKLARELAEKLVLKGADTGAITYVHMRSHAGKDEPVTLLETIGPCWFSSRMVMDEWRRTTRGVEGHFTSANQPTPEAKKRKTSTDNPVDWDKWRSVVFERDGGKCQHCGVVLGLAWNLDHLIPRSRGGTNRLENLVASCIPCNRDKSDTMPGEYPRQGGPHDERQGDELGYGPTSSSTSSPSEQETLSRSALDEPEIPACLIRKQKEPDRFHEFYAAYPLHKGPGDAEKAWKAALKKAIADDIIAGAKRYAEERRGQDAKFTSYPAKWLRAESWRDEVGVINGSHEPTLDELLASKQKAESMGIPTAKLDRAIEERTRAAA